MSKYKLVIFDWDGTLVDSTDRIVDSMQQAALTVGLPKVSNEAVQHIIGLGLPEAIRTLWADISETELALMVKRYAQNFVTDSAVPMSMYPEARQLLEELLLRGFLLAVATGKTRKGLDRMLRDLRLGHFFAATRCADETRSKPHPQMLQELLASLNLTAPEALMVGDTSFDLDMARSIEMDAVAMTYGAHPLERLELSQPKAFCRDIYELRKWIVTHG